jgi:hypothetical protein
MLDDIIVKMDIETSTSPTAPNSFYVSKSLYDEIKDWKAKELAFYNAQPWYRKLIYKWNMWRTKV